MSKRFEGGHQQCHDPAIRIVSRRRSTLRRVKLSHRLLAGGARVHIDFHANRHFDDLWGFPGHLALLFEPDDFRPQVINYCGTKSSPVKSLVAIAAFRAAAHKEITYLCERASKLPGLNGFKVEPRKPRW